jgi:GNAT superfamily N-acetyltransferase
MRDFPPGWATDLAVLELTGSTITDRGSHLVIRTPDNPTFHWGNCLFVADEAAVGDAERWLHEFAVNFPDAYWVAIGLIQMPDGVSTWTAHGLEVELDDVLTTRSPPRQTPLPPGYRVRRFGGRDWEQSVASAVSENDRTREQDPSAYQDFATRRTGARRALSERDVAAFFGAFTEETLVAELGIVRCGTTARYQHVTTDVQHRRRGLSSHLLGVAGSWAAEHGCDRWVIVTESTNPAGRVYRRAGFRPDTGNAQVYRNSRP